MVTEAEQRELSADVTEDVVGVVVDPGPNCEAAAMMGWMQAVREESELSAVRKVEHVELIV